VKIKAQKLKNKSRWFLWLTEYSTDCMHLILIAWRRCLFIIILHIWALFIETLGFISHLQSSLLC